MAAAAHLTPEAVQPDLRHQRCSARSLRADSWFPESQVVSVQWLEPAVHRKMSQAVWPHTVIPVPYSALSLLN